MKNYVTTVKERAEDIGARAMVGATNTVGRLMNTKAGRFALVAPMMMSAMAVRASAEGDVSAHGFIDGIMGVLGPGVIGLGSLVAVVGGIQTGVGFKDDNADGKTRGFQTLIGGAIIAAVGALVPTSISLGG